jgi:hypothetical protein
MDRLSEVIFGLIMVLTFTGSLSVMASDDADVRRMLVAALGCGIAWGIVDGVMFLLASLHEHGDDLAQVRALRAAGSREEAHAVIRGYLPGPVADLVDEATLDRMRAAILERVPADARPRLTRTDLRGAGQVFLIVVASNLPVILPFLFVEDPFFALRLSNLVALGMLAVIGYAYGRVSGLPALWTAVAMVLLGAVLVVLTIALGG